MAANSGGGLAEDHSPYPSPRNNSIPNNSIPFYHHPHHNQQQQQHSQQHSQHSQHSQRLSHHHGDRLDLGLHNGSGHGEQEADSHQPVPDDPQLRANLATMMGTFGQFESPPMHSVFSASTSESPSLQHESLAFVQTGSSPEMAAPTSSSRQKERSKVSRACDECRRKKIRCDAVDETATLACTNCVRTSASCTFSRQPLKRGPSKGYIKELAERLNSLEQQVQPSQMQSQSQPQMDLQQVQQAMVDGLHAFGRDSHLRMEPRVGEKRSHDVSEGVMNGQSHAQYRPSPMPQMRMSQFGHTLMYPQHQQQGHLYAQPMNHSQPFWSRTGDDNRQEPIGLSFDTDHTTSITNFDWDDDVIDEYYRIIHQTFPLLPSNKTRLRQRLSDCPPSLREAFLVALDCLMRTFPTTMLPPNAEYPQALKKAGELLAKYPFDNPSSHTNATNLIYLQTLLLMALESDNHGPATIRGQAGPSRAEWLGRAAGVAGQLEINVIRTDGQSILSGDRDSEERLARRVWWVLFILDRWHASSTADLLKLPENSVVLLPEDQILLGESTYHLARLSFIIGHLAAILTTTKTPSTDVMAPSNPASSLIGLTLAGEIDRFRESVESVWGSLNLVHLSYHHCHLLIKRLSRICDPTELAAHAVKVATVLNSRLTPVTPLNHHFGALAAMTLCELCDVPRTRTEALRGLDHLVEALGEGRGLAGKLDSEGWDGAVRELVVKKKERMAQMELQGTLDVITTNEAAFDPTMLTRYGYLTALGQGMFHSK